MIAIDGPAGSGKSTVARLLARRLSYIYVDTGAMYRALTLKALRKGLDLNNEEKLIELTRDTELDILNDPSGGIKVMLDGEDVTSLIRTPELTNNVSYIARVGGVREKMLDSQRMIGGRGDSVCEGRDMGTVVFPETKYKFYLDAEFPERASRRYKELLGDGCKLSREEIEKDLKVRDHKDMNRDIAPLKKADDAVYLDTTNMGIDEVVDKLTVYVNEGRG
ncbi:MAG: (d)CMP kinase [Candidatus Omnitrophica bacterium]|nr:(d)CMP kinase [Candidatus Omnitrophota bacterium]